MRRTDLTLEDNDILESLITMPEVCKILRCSSRTIRRFISGGKLKGVRVGRRYCFRKQDIEQFIGRCLTRKLPMSGSQQQEGLTH